MEMVSNYSMKEVVNKHSRVIESITNSLKGIISHSDDALNEERLLGLVENTVFESRYISLIDYDEITDVIKAIFLRVSSKYSILSNYIEDPSINEIMVNGYNRIFVEKNKKITEVDNSFYSDDELEGLIRMFASDIHREINEAHPIVDARLENGYRVNGVLKNVALNGPILTIRKFANDEITLDDLVNNDTMPRVCSDFLTKLVAAKYNIFISGGTSSGKQLLFAGTLVVGTALSVLLYHNIFFSLVLLFFYIKIQEIYTEYMLDRRKRALAEQFKDFLFILSTSIGAGRGIDKLQLVLTLIMINDNNCQMLIGAERYLIEPELIYSVRNRTDYNSIGILFYPDTTMTPFNIKLIRFMDKIGTKNKKKAINCFELIKEELAKNEIYRAKSIAEKNLNRFLNEKVV